MYVYDNFYSISELAKTAYALIMTRLFFPKASLIRRPFYLRGGARVDMGSGFRTGYRCRIETFGGTDDLATKLYIGKNCHIGDDVHIAAAEQVKIGDNCLFASHIFVSDCSHGDTTHSAPVQHPELRPLISKPTTIGDNVWVGENVSILMGATIGTGCIVGANSVVNKEFPDYCIIAGTPARIIKRYDFSSLEWVRY